MKKFWVIWAGLAGASGLMNPVTPLAQQASAPGATTCSVSQTLKQLPADIRETSGLAVSRRHNGVLWTHNDSGKEPAIYALGTDGSVKARVKVGGATFTDWEDIEISACDGGECLYIADIGDNDARRTHVTVWEVKEPDLSSASTAARAIHARYADGPQDAEALFRLPSGDMFVVTKGRHGAVRLYKYSTAGANGHGTLQVVREIAPHPTNDRDRVTAATSSLDGKWVAIRTYQNLFVYRTEDLLGSGAPAITYSLASLQEKQGEAITLSDSGDVWVTSEAENKNALPAFARLTCTLP